MDVVCVSNAANGVWWCYRRTQRDKTRVRRTDTMSRYKGLLEEREEWLLIYGVVASRASGLPNRCGSYPVLR